MSDKVYEYNAALTLDDHTEHLVDLEERGWAEPERLARVVRFALIPKTGSSLPVVVVNIPPEGKPVFKSRVLVRVTNPARIRCYAVGYKQGSNEVLTWVLPNGTIEVGPDPLMADLILRHTPPQEE